MDTCPPPQDLHGVPAARQPEDAEQRDEAGADRDTAAERRDDIADQRDDAAEDRDSAGRVRDQAAQARDRAATARDRAADARDREVPRHRLSDAAGAPSWVHLRSGAARSHAADDRRRARQDRDAGATERLAAGRDRTTSLTDRGSGATERDSAGVDRGTALADRGAAAREREHASLDGLTGAYIRSAGILQLEREVLRAQRLAAPLVVAFVDVDHLKAVNDSGGHAAGDRLLVSVVDALRSRLRLYDLVIRYGGDEFLCVLPGMSLVEAAQRFRLVNEDLAPYASVSVGVAAAVDDETPEDLVERADAELYACRALARDAGVAGTTVDILTEP